MHLKFRECAHHVHFLYTLVQTLLYSGLILSRLNSKEVTRLSPLLLFLSIIRFCGIPGNGVVIYVSRNRWRNYLLEGIQRCIGSSICSAFYDNYNTITNYPKKKIQTNECKKRQTSNQDFERVKISIVSAFCKRPSRREERHISLSQKKRRNLP